MSLEPGTQFGPYTIRERLARGAGRTVLKAARDDGSYVLHLLRSQVGGDVSQFLEGAKRLAELEHPNLARVVDVGEHEARAYVATEFVEGENLGSRVRLKGVPPLDWSLRVLQGVAEAVACCHAAGLAHRDLTPADVVITSEDTPVLVGFALLAGDTSRPGAGTHPGYLAPEQLRGDVSQTGPWTDVYALGVTLYYMLTGGPPFGGGGYRAVVQQVLEQPPPDPAQHDPSIPRALSELCRQALSKDPDARPASSDVFREALRESRP